MFVNRHLKTHFKSLIRTAIKKGQLTQDFLKNFTQGLPKNSLVKQNQQYEMHIAQYLLNRISFFKTSEQAIKEAVLLVEVFLNRVEITLSQTEQNHFKQFFERLFSHYNFQEENIKNIKSQQNEPYDCICKIQGSNSAKQVQKCYKCGQKHHIECFWQREVYELFECPRCFLLNCLPEKPVREILFLGYLKQSMRNKIDHRIKFYTNNLKETNSTIEIRCCRLNKENRYQLAFPQNCTIFSSTQKKLIQLRPLWSNSPLKRRNDKEIVIQKYLLSYLNTMTVQERNIEQKDIKMNPSDHHMIAILQTFPLQKERLFRNLILNNHLSISLSKQNLKKYINGINSEVKIEKLNVSMKCQYFNIYISNPVRSVHCHTHYQPFDLSSFITISMNAKQSIQRWKCPICRRRSYDVLIDDYLCDIIQRQKSPSQITFDNKAEVFTIDHQKVSQNDKDYSAQDLSQIENENRGLIASESITSNKKDSVQIVDLQQQNQQQNFKRKHHQSQRSMDRIQTQKKRLKLSQPKANKSNNPQASFKQGIKNASRVIPIDEAQQNDEDITKRFEEELKKRILLAQQQKKKESSPRKEVNPLNILNKVNNTHSQDIRSKIIQKSTSDPPQNSLLSSEAENARQKKLIRQRQLRQLQISKLNCQLQMDDLMSLNTNISKMKLSESTRISSMRWINSLIAKPIDLD